MVDSKLNGAFYGPSIPPSQTHRSVGRGATDCICCFPCCILSTLLKLIFSIVIALGVIVLVLWLVLRPNEIKSYVETASLTQFNLSNNTNNNNALQYDLRFNMSIRNPNRRVGIYYDYIESQVFYSDSRIGFKVLDPFYQDHKTTSMLNQEFTNRAVALQGSAVDTFKREKGEGFFYIDVKVYNRIRLKIWIFKFRGFKPEIDCTLKLPVPANSANTTPVTSFERTKCDVRYF